MGIWDDMLAIDAQFLVDDVLGGESVTYTDSNGREFAFAAVINRAPVAAIAKTETKAGPLFASMTTIFLPYDPDGVVGVPACPQKNDTVCFPLNVGSRPSAQHITELISQDAGGFLCRVR